ncbi:transposase [Anaerocolumna chitinilytica]|uniref:Transposase n=1 Tax=Anaerocolumna chitinilytica TaxID=1727145 RepID=A0A7M3S9L2_9FIRM|nr:transposase [Anaerocolumna chitinilytica]BCK01280.1 transposase [Anaerocolumna chitinilytica]
MAEGKGYSLSSLCQLGKISRSAYYKWLNHEDNPNDKLNKELAERIEAIHDKHPDMGYRRIRDSLEHDDNINVNDKRVLRICRKKKIRSNLKYRNNGCTKSAADPAYTAENILNREFNAGSSNEKWVTDVTEFKYGTSIDHIRKLYLSVILDLCDRRPVAYIINDHNDNKLVFDTFDDALVANPGAHPLLHSDRGYQYTSKVFHQKLVDAGMTQSMSRVAHCIDNGPMEGFWGILKREMYYGKKFHTREALVNAITEYMDYYTNKRPQRKLGVLTPMEYHQKLLLAA